MIRAAAEDAGRDPAKIAFQARLRDAHNLDAIPARVAALQAAGFTWATINMAALEAAGIQGIPAQIETLKQIRERIS